MSEPNQIEATRDLVGSFSALLDEFTACWGGLRVANDQMRAASLIDLIDGSGARSTLAEWIELRLDSEYADLIAPLLSLLCSSGGTTAGALHAFELSLDAQAPIGAQHLADALNAAFEAHQVRHTIGGSAIRGTATELLVATAVANHRFGLPDRQEEDVERLTETLLIAAFDRDYGAYGLGGVPPATEVLPIATQIRGWAANAVVGSVELVALPGLEIRQTVLTSTVAPHLRVLLRSTAEIEELIEIRAQLGPGLMTAWDSFAHAFGEEGDGLDSLSVDPDDDPLGPPGGYRELLGPEAFRLLQEGIWFSGLFADDSAFPRLGGGIRALLADSVASSPWRSGDPHVVATLGEARSLLERLARNLGSSGPQHVAALARKAADLEATAGPTAALELTEYVLHVAEALVAVADEAEAFAQHLDRHEGDRIGDLDVALRLAAIVAWLDGVARWVVSDANATTGDRDPERAATPPSGYRDPRKLMDEMEGSLPARYPIDEFRLVLEQREAQWDELATLDDRGPPDLERDHSDAVDFEGFANR